MVYVPEWMSPDPVRVVMTTAGNYMENALDKRVGVDDNDDAKVFWVEYRMPGADDIVHRSAHVALKGEGVELIQAVLA